MKHHSLTESIELHPISSCTSDKIGNTELRDILKEYYGDNEISYTADYDSEIWGEVMSYLERDCKLIKELELKSGIVTIYETDVVNEFLARFEWESKGKNFLFWKKESTNDFVTGQ
jgi:hypothetical protein